MKKFVAVAVMSALALSGVAAVAPSVASASPARAVVTVHAAKHVKHPRQEVSGKELLGWLKHDAKKRVKQLEEKYHRSHPDWTANVWTTGFQSQIDRCKGLVDTYFGSYGHSYAEHNDCGGSWILKVKTGDIVKLTGVGAGLYKATGSKVVSKGASASSLPSYYNLQTCYFSSNKMRLVALKKL